MKDGDTDLLDAVGAGILIFINDKVVYANKALARIFGYAQPSHILDLPSYMELVATHDRGRVGKYSAARLSGHDAPASYEFQAIHSDGRLIYLSNQPVLIQWGGMVATLATVMDITPLKSTEQGLRQSEQRFQDFAEVAADWFWEQDENLRFSLISTDFGMITETKQEDFLGKTRRETGLFDMDEEKLLAHEAKLLAREPFSNFEFSRMLPNGEMVDISISGKPVYNAEGGFTGYRGVGRNITAQKQAEKISRHNQQRIRNFAEAASDVFWERDAEGRFTYLSDRFYEITGDLRDSVIGKTSEDMGRVFERPVGGNDPREDVAKRKPYRNLVSSRTYADGRKHWTRSGGIPIFDEHGAFLGYRGSSTDITDEVEAREVADQANRRFLDALDSMPNSVDLYDSDDRLIYQNDIARQHRQSLYGQDFAGATFEEFVRAAVTHGVVPDAKDREEQWIRERMKRHRDPEGVLVVQGRGSPDSWHEMREHRTPDGSTLVIWIDITESVKQEEQLRHAQKMEAVGQLTGGIAHDFNNLLGIVMGNLQLIERDAALAGQDQEHLRQSLAAVKRGAALTHRLLAFARTQPLQPRSVAVASMIIGLQDMLRRTISEAIELRFELQDGIPVMVDASQLENALLNLAINARDAMVDGGVLTITTADHEFGNGIVLQGEAILPGRYCLIEISDTGTGMDQETLDQVFDPFFTTKEFGKGSGLGLSMVQGFIRQSDGHIDISSEVGAGTIVRLYLPISETVDDIVENKHDHPEEPPQGNGQVILVLEDDLHLRQTVVGMLESLGYAALEAEDAASTMAILDGDEIVDLLFCDVVLPGGASGPEIANDARAKYPDLKVLFCSGYAENALTHDGRLEPGVQLLAKPYDFAALTAAIHAALADDEAATEETPVGGR